MKGWLGLALVFLLVLSACSTQPASAPAPAAPEVQAVQPVPVPATEAGPKPSSIVAPPSSVPEPTPVAAPAPVPVATSSDYDPKVKALIDLATTKFKTAQYEFSGTGNPIPGNIYRVRGTLIKVTKQRPLELKDMTNYYDTVYLDTVKKTATGYCTDAWGKKDCLVMNKQYIGLDYAQYIRKTPFEWIPQIDKSAQLTGTQVFNGKDTKKVEFDKNGNHYTFLLDKIYGAPVYVAILPVDKIDLPDAVPETYEYGAFIGNGVTLADVTEPTPA